MGFSAGVKAASVPAMVTARYTMWQFPADPALPRWVLIVRPSCEPNNVYQDAEFKLPSQTRAMGAPSVAKMHANAVEFVPLFAKHILVGWENVCEDETPTVPTVFSPEKALELLTAIVQPPPYGRPDAFAQLRVFCNNLDNFREPVVDAAELGKR